MTTQTPVNELTIEVGDTTFKTYLNCPEKLAPYFERMADAARRSRNAFKWAHEKTQATYNEFIDAKTPFYAETLTQAAADAERYWCEFKVAAQVFQDLALDAGVSLQNTGDLIVHAMKAPK